MKTITDPSRIPHGGSFHVKHPISGQEFASPSIGAVFSAFQKHSKDNNYPVLATAEIETLLCDQHPSICSDRTRSSNHELSHIQSQTESLSPAEIASLLPELTDATLIGNRIAALTSALGIPTCNGCAARRNWLNRAHKWLREHA